MSTEERSQLVTRMGMDIGQLSVAAESGHWPLARMWFTRFMAAAGMLAMEIDDNDPVEREN